MVHVLLKPGLENFEHYFTSVWDECSCAVVWAFFGIAFLTLHWSYFQIFFSHIFQTVRFMSKRRLGVSTSLGSHVGIFLFCVSVSTHSVFVLSFFLFFEFTNFHLFARISGWEIYYRKWALDLSLYILWNIMVLRDWLEGSEERRWQYIFFFFFLLPSVPVHSPPVMRKWKTLWAQHGRRCRGS